VCWGVGEDERRRCSSVSWLVPVERKRHARVIVIMRYGCKVWLAIFGLKRIILFGSGWFWSWFNVGSSCLKVGS
jgi:hypothetical protein